MLQPAGLPEHLRQVNRTLVMGILNVTPDSFSDGGRFVEPGAALHHAEQLVQQGADLIDVGGESTRPGARPVDPIEEQRRVLPVVAALVERGIDVSIDTMHASTAAAAAAAGACLINDVSGGLADPDMLATVAALELPFVAMHWPQFTDRDLANQQFTDVCAEVGEHLTQRKAAAVEAGLDPRRVIVDPGLGFAKEHQDNWALLANPHRWVPAETPVLIGASRKRFLGALLATPDGQPAALADRDAATAAVSTLAAAAGVWCVRVHDVRVTAAAVAVGSAWADAREGH